MMMEKDRVWRVSPEGVFGSRLNPRKRFKVEKVLELADSIRVHGVIVPLKCRPLVNTEDDLEVVYGESRLKGARLVWEGYTDGEGTVWPANRELLIPVMVEELDDKTVFELMMIENLLREGLSPSEEAAGYLRMQVEFGLSAREVSERLGVPRRRVDKRLALLDLPDSVLEGIDGGSVPLYAAAEALRVPAEWCGGESRMEALGLAVDAGSEARAHDLIEARYLRPWREAERWGSEEFRDEVRSEYGSEVQFLDYGDCRELFPVGTTALTAVTAGQYVEADVVPEPPAVHGWVDDSWRELAERYGAPLYVACDGAMTPVLLARRDLVAEAARVAHTYRLSVVEDEGGLFFRAGESPDDTWVPDVEGQVAFSVLSHGGRLPEGFSPGRVYFVNVVDGLGFRVAEALFAAEPLALKDEGEGVRDHPLRMAVLDLSQCPFLPVEGRIASDAARLESKAAQVEVDKALVAKAAKAAEMVAGLELAIRNEVAKGKGSDVLLAKAARFAIAAGEQGLSGNDHPGHHVMLALEKGEDGDLIFSAWEDVGVSRAGIESFCVCMWMLYLLDLWEGDDLRECPQWKEAAAVYGV